MNFAGHETFAFRYNWLTKGYARLAGDGAALGQLEATMKELGLGKNMARSLRHWMLATGMCEMVDPPRGRLLRPTWLAELLLDRDSGRDPFLEDPGTLWIIHWELCAQDGRSTTWHVAFSLVRDREFVKKDLVAAVERYARANGSGVSNETIERDIDCLLHCYVHSEGRSVVPDDALACPLTELGLITRIQTGRDELFAFSRGPQQSLSDELLAFAVVDHWQRLHRSAMSLSFDQLAYGPGSPGMVFRLDEASLAARLEAVEALSGGSLRFSEGAGVRQLSLTGAMPNHRTLLDSYYAGQLAATGTR